jgi:hypothetical protein
VRGGRHETAAAPSLEIETNQEYWGVEFAVTDSKFADGVEETLQVQIGVWHLPLWFPGAGILRASPTRLFFLGRGYPPP